MTRLLPRLTLLLTCAAALHCGKNTTNPTPGADLATTMSGTDGGGGGSPDLAGGMVITPNPACMGTASDGQACGTGCPSGQTCAGYSAAALACYKSCDLNAPSCACGRKCVSVQTSTGMVGACLPANGLGEQCGNNPSGMPYNTGNCEQGTSCVGSTTGARYCVGPCTTSQDCPAQTTCSAVVAGMMVASTVCWYNSNNKDGKALGSPCAITDTCVENALCDGTCKQRCGGPWDHSCNCQPLVDGGGKLIGYICK
jgi:hypothetical protein